MRNCRSLHARVVLTLLLLVGCSGHPNPDPAAAVAERRVGSLRAVAGRRASVVRQAEGATPVVVVYDVADLLCREPGHFTLPGVGHVVPVSPGQETDGVLTLDRAEDQGQHRVCLDPDALVELLESRLPEADDTKCECLRGVLLVSGPWGGQEKVGALLARISTDVAIARSGSKSPGR